jgi:hypothetical protein
MFQYLLKNADFSGLLKFVSPGFFRVVPPRMIIGVASVLKKNYADTSYWKRVRAEYGTRLESAGLALDFAEDTDLSEDRRKDKALGEIALEVYFHQILTCDTWILDFRSEVFHYDPTGRLVWAPKPFYSLIEPEFLRAIRAMYIGFYENDQAQFDKALNDLGLLKAGKSLHDHFGQGDQSAVQFQLTRFQKTFADVFAVCNLEGIRLDKDFAILGLMLLGLYELLESMDSSFDVRLIFERSRKRASIS